LLAPGHWLAGVSGYWRLAAGVSGYWLLAAGCWLKVGEDLFQDMIFEPAMQAVYLFFRA
jgi:hypothetical protein